MLQQPDVRKRPLTKRHTSASVLHKISQMYARTQHEQMSSRNLFLRVKPQKRRLTSLKSLCKTAHSTLVTSCCLYTHCWCSSCSVNPILSSPRTHVRYRTLRWHWLTPHFRKNCCQSPRRANRHRALTIPAETEVNVPFSIWFLLYHGPSTGQISGIVSSK